MHGGDDKYVYNIILHETPEVKKPPEKHGCQNNIKIDHQEGDVRVQTAFSWLRVESSGRFL
jgi:hypothetical protein